MFGAAGQEEEGDDEDREGNGSKHTTTVGGGGERLFPCPRIHTPSARMGWVTTPGGKRLPMADPSRRGHPRILVQGQGMVGPDKGFRTFFSNACQPEGMFERIGRSWELVRASWRILSRDTSLLVFPILSGICTLAVVASFILPIILSGAAFRGMGAGPAPWYVLLFLFYVACYFVAIFFNTALVTCVYALLQGKETSIGEGLSGAARHLVPLFLWAVVAATVGIILRAVGERTGIIGRIAVALVGGVWSLITIFVVPVLVLEDKGVVDAVKESAALFRRTWGESVVGSVSLGVIFGAIVLLGLLGVVAAAFTGSMAVILLAVALFILLVVVVGVVSSAMQGIFFTALYTYAKTGIVPAGFGKGTLEQAFVPKEPAFGTGNI